MPIARIKLKKYILALKKKTRKEKNFSSLIFSENQNIAFPRLTPYCYHLQEVYGSLAKTFFLALS